MSNRFSDPQQRDKAMKEAAQLYREWEKHPVTKALVRRLARLQPDLLDRLRAVPQNNELPGKQAVKAAFIAGKLEGLDEAKVFDEETLFGEMTHE